MKTKENKNILNDCNMNYINNNLYLKKEDKENLINYFSLFGKSDLNGQIINCRKYKAVFKNRLDCI